MSRALGAALVSAVAVLLAAIWLMMPPQPLAARFGPNDCQRIVLVDAETGNGLQGAEDMALAPDGDTLVLSVHDRIDTARPDGGLYAVSLRRLGDDGPAAAQPLHGTRGLDGPFRPHGIALSPDGSRLAVVNRPAPRRGAVEIGALGRDGWRAERAIEEPRLCRANDLDFVPAADGVETLRVTIDRADCSTSLRDLLGGSGSTALIRRGRLAVERTGLHFPNGVHGEWVAETRGKRLRGPNGTLSLPGGPDNLAPAEDRLVTALHPNLVRTAFYLGGWVDRLASRIVAVDPATGVIEVLYDDPSGALFSAATVGVLAGDRLVAGSVRDDGLLYCEARG